MNIYTPQPEYRSRTLTRAAVTAYLEREAPDRIPMSDPEKMRRRDYSTLYVLGQSEGDYWIPRAIDRNRVQLDEYRDRQFVQSGWVPIEDLCRANFEATQYFGAGEWQFNSLFWFVASTTGGLKYFRRFFQSIPAWMANNASLPSAERTRALQIAIEKVQQTGDANLTLQEFLRLKRSQHNHPEIRSAMHSWEFVLNSLVESGELAANRGDGYRVLPRALITLDQYMIEERRISAQSRLQWTIGIAAALATLAAGLLPLLNQLFGTNAP